GKVMYYKIEYGTDPFNYYVNDVYYVMSLEVDEDITVSPDWDELQDASNTQINDSFNVPLYYNKQSSTPNGISFEIVVDKNDFNSQNSNVNKLSNDPYILNTDGSTRKVITSGNTAGIDLQLF